jgi:hypothetical protein
MTIPEQAGPAGGRLRFVGVLVPLGLILTAGGLLIEHSASRVSVIRAAVDKAPDADRDGLVDGLEHRLGTSAADADTDKDGFSDAEEIARRSSPRSAQSLPEHGLPIDVGIVAYGEGSMLHALFVVYAADGSLGDKHLTLSALIGEHPVRIPSDVVSRLGSLHTVPASRRPGKLFLLDVPLLPRTVYAAGSLSLAASVAAPRTSLEASADTVDLIAMDEEIYLRLPWRRIGHAKLASENAPDSGSGGGAGETFDGGGATSTSVFLPAFIRENEDPGSATGSGGTSGSTSIPGQVCVQKTRPVGVAGGAIIYEVVSSECVDGWDGFCSTSCGGALGTISRGLDPVTYGG